MLSGLIVCVLVVGTVASKPGMPFGAMYGARVPSQEHPEPCCPPRYYTVEKVETTTYLVDGIFTVEHENVERANDALAEMYSFQDTVDYSNGTVLHFKMIVDFKKGVRYEIEKTGDELVCHVSDLGRQKFQDGCIPNDAVFVGEATLGDDDLIVDSWYFSMWPFNHVVKTVQRGSCIPVATLTRKYDRETGKEIRLGHVKFYNFKLGICDREKYFKVPELCEEGRALKEPTRKMLEKRRRGLFY